MSDLPEGFVTAGHAVLFSSEEQPRCDVCGEALRDDEEDDEPPASGRGMLVWSRGDERRYQEAPLCSSCAVAIGVSALSRWEIEEDEG